MPKSRELVAVLDEDLVSVLRALGLLDALEHGDLRCANCGTVLTLRNLSGFIPQEEGTYRIFCDEAACTEMIRGAEPESISHG
jgi:hypothetical protein